MQTIDLVMQKFPNLHISLNMSIPMQLRSWVWCPCTPDLYASILIRTH